MELPNSCTCYNKGLQQITMPLLFCSPTEYRSARKLERPFRKSWQYSKFRKNSGRNKSLWYGCIVLAAKSSTSRDTRALSMTWGRTLAFSHWIQILFKCCNWFCKKKVWHILSCLYSSVRWKESGMNKKKQQQKLAFRLVFVILWNVFQYYSKIKVFK